MQKNLLMNLEILIQNLIDKNGSLSIEFGAYGVPETFIINKNKKLLKNLLVQLIKNH